MTELLVYLAIMVVPVFMIPGVFAATSMAKRVMLYLVAASIVIVKVSLWDGGIELLENDLFVMAFVLYAITSIAWSANYTIAMREVIQLLAFVVMYFGARQCGSENIVVCMALIGPVGFVIAIIAINTKQMQKAIEKKDGDRSRLIVFSRSIFPFGNKCLAGCIYMIGTIASMYIVVHGHSGIGAAICAVNLGGLMICGSKGAYVGTIAGSAMYAILGA